MTRGALLAEALALPVDARAELVRELAASIQLSGRADVEEKWATEITRRLELYRQGKLEAVPAGDVFDGIRQKLRDSRG